MNQESSERGGGSWAGVPDGDLLRPALPDRQDERPEMWAGTDYGQVPTVEELERRFGQSFPADIRKPQDLH